MGPDRKSDTAAAVEFENVCFNYDTPPLLSFISKKNRGDDIGLRSGEAALEDTGVRRPVLHDLSFRVEWGKTSALVGPTGAGKSTIFDLISGVISPMSGRILIGGKDAGRMGRTQRLRSLAVVPQEPGLFDESIYENIRYGLQEIGDEDAVEANSGVANEIRLAAAAAGVKEFSDRLDNGLNSSCGPRGSLLSGGQRQRIAIARALIRKSPILMLDEPTSALDAGTEACIQKAIKEWEPNQAVFVISHRLATVRDADMILVLKDGGVVEQGTHHELRENAGWYEENYQAHLLL